MKDITFGEVFAYIMGTAFVVLSIGVMVHVACL